MAGDQKIDIVIDNDVSDWWSNARKNQRGEAGNSQQQPKIQKVPRMLRAIESNKKCYDPFVVSIGPYHHGNVELEEMERLKVSMAEQLVEESKTSLNVAESQTSFEILYKAVEDVADEARKCYANDAFAISHSEDPATEGIKDPTKGNGEGSAKGSAKDSAKMCSQHSTKEVEKKFTQMMFLDGCFILQFIYCLLRHPEKLKMNSHIAALVSRDLFLLENQLPFQVLKSLMDLRFKETDDEKRGKTLINDFMNHIRAVPPQRETCREMVSKFVREKILRQAQEDLETQKKVDHQPLHLLELFHIHFVGENNIVPDPEINTWYHYRPAMELKRVGIKFEPSTTSLFTDIEFKPTCLGGTLQLPPLTLNDSTKSLILNLVAYEACPGAPNLLWVTSYICFMDSMIDHPEDVQELRSKGILLNFLGSDQQVADLFNDIANFLVPNPYAYIKVKKDIESHYWNIFKRWIIHYKSDVSTTFWRYASLFGIILSALKAFVAVVPMKNTCGDGFPATSRA